MQLEKEPIAEAKIQGVMEVSPALKAVLLQAIKESPGATEEEGGIILQKDEEFRFVKLNNQNTGKPHACVLYEVDKNDFGQLIIPLMNEEGWNLYASYHTHPGKCPAFPSGTDLDKLFKGFPTNFIYSPGLKSLNRFDYKKDTYPHIWACHTILL